MNRRTLFFTAITIFIACLLWGVAILSLGEPPYWVLILATLISIIASEFITEQLSSIPLLDINEEGEPESSAPEDEEDLKSKYKQY